MRLTHLKLAGFKSFVDPTICHTPGSIVVIVGPNGCGKSNLIDAVRWVMGESTARQLRGESMEDVIFSGSADRRPVGQASVELVFDNSAGKLGGAWARYSEIAIKRQVSRGGQSAYYLNGTRCRRRDITDIFLGTGLGPRSYAIIEQGMISRIIESRPEELRVFLEEAAGISKYKERRRETELRIRHTRENLDRLNDVREELHRQLQHLQRQARNAEKYRHYKAEERRLKAGVLALRWRAYQSTLNEQQAQIEIQVNEQQRLVAEQRRLEVERVQGRERSIILRDALEQAQAEHYRIGAEVSRLEQTCAHQRALQQQRRDECERIAQAYQTARTERDTDQQRSAELVLELEQIEPALETAQNALDEAQRQLDQQETALQDCQQQWEVLTQQLAEPLRQAEVMQMRISQLQRQTSTTQQRMARLQQERQVLDLPALAQAQEALQAHSEQLQATLDEQRLQLDDLKEESEQLHGQRQECEQQQRRVQTEYQTRQGRLASLQTLQEAHLGEQGRALAEWLQQQGVNPVTRLAERLQVDAGWEAAAETVLQPWLQALYIEDAAIIANAELPPGPLYLYTAVTTQTVGKRRYLGQHVRNAGSLQPLLDAVALDDESDTATSVISQDGLWRGVGWWCRAGSEDTTGSVLLRERELRELHQQLAQDQQQLQYLAEHINQLETQLASSQSQSQHLQEQVNQLHSEVQITRHRIETGQQQLDRQRERQAQLDSEYGELQQQWEDDQVDLLDAQQQWAQARQAGERLAEQQQQLTTQREELRIAVHQARQQSAQQQQHIQQYTLRQQAMHNEARALQQSVARLDAQLRELDTRRQALDNALEPTDLQTLQQELESWLSQRVASDQGLGRARQALEHHDALQADHEQASQAVEHQQTALREQLEQARLAASETRVHCDNLVEQLAAWDTTPDDTLAELAETATEADWQHELERMGQRIQRLGAINLAAIEEHARLAERKAYLDSQDEDLCSALATLEEAIKRIDAETRSRFQATFDEVNGHLNSLFPRLFGGGQAFLDLVGNDTLDSGVALMAKPPGKRVGRIQLLSGGEKALTALALVFAIFQLNPAPFCLLDEVDAPLDEANVGRFGRLVQELAEQVQFIIVTHNKTTMTVAQYLMGVTMHEPGVSRLVSVDVDEAVRLAAV